MKKISSLVRKILSEVGRNEMLAWGTELKMRERTLAKFAVGIRY